MRMYMFGAVAAIGFAVLTLKLNDSSVTDLLETRQLDRTQMEVVFGGACGTICSDSCPAQQTQCTNGNCAGQPNEVGCTGGSAGTGNAWLCVGGPADSSCVTSGGSTTCTLQGVGAFTCGCVDEACTQLPVNRVGRTRPGDINCANGSCG